MGTVQRVQQFIETKGISKYRFYQESGLSNGSLDKGENIGSDKCEKILYVYPELNPDWLITGRGSMLKEEKENLKPQINYENKGAPYYNIDFIGGFDLVMNNQTLNPDYYIDFAPFNKEGVVWCNITGRSMEPELNNGDYIAMKEMTDPIQYLPFGEVYGFVTNSYRTVKRMGKSDREGFIRLIPTNKSPEYSEQDIPVNIIRKVYAVLGSMHRLF
ncbi:S24 family peptidase [Parabacteroides sp. AM08-6]|uniref:S24 family peptidase n=1 Tax=Parabacteroides sp. AM08-6 TaxID=2292053 RepID=UPI000EFE27F8|nr:S24 family peptidase [Parabacteroides sp. AM08-6]RHJ81202.1 S24 family peptidase [Parabacteroides sp. AM08-6]